MTSLGLSALVIFSAIFFLIGVTYNTTAVEGITVTTLSLISVPVLCLMHFLTLNSRPFTFSHFLSQNFYTFRQNLRACFNSKWYMYFVAPVLIAGIAGAMFFFS